MNLNVKLDGEEEQGVQYVNRFAINIPSGAAAFNLNIVNPGLSNQSYILNPVNSVGQNIVAYQPPVALQSYIALPTETEGNIIHSLPVGVPVVSGLPVPTGLLQNNFVNTSIIIGNEDCNSSEMKSSSNNVNPENEIKINFIEKPVEELASSKANGIEDQNVAANCTTQANAETVVKKPCPLEMSIKAANIDIEFEKCEPEVPILLGNCQTIVEKPIPVESMPLQPNVKGNLLKVPLEISSFQTPRVEVKETESKKIKTEITWENNNKQETVDNGFQETLICEVEEANDDDDENDDGDEEDGDEEEGNGEETDEEEEVNSNCKTVKSRVSSSEADSSSEESDSLPLSVALKLNKKNKFPHRKRKNKEKNEVLSNDKLIEDGRKKKKLVGNKKQREKGEKEEEEEDDNDDDLDDENDKEGKENDGEDWSESDDDVLNLKRIKSEFNYKCFYEPNSGKSATSLVFKIDDKFKKFVRVRSCCSKRECGKKISVQDQKIAHKIFYDLESNAKRDAYLVNCIEHVRKIKNVEYAKETAENKYLEKTNIQLEIENESNGNQKLSDEIQKAIDESLKDCVANEGEAELNDVGAEKGEKNTWNFYVVIDRCRKKVCLQFLLKLFQITKSRIKQLQKKILSGAPLADESGKGNQKLNDVWEVAKCHLDGLNGSECTDCNANPRHRFLSERCTKEDLFDSFKEYYLNKFGREPNIKYASYKRFLDKKTSVSFCTNKKGICTECEELKRHKKRKQIKTEKGSSRPKQKTSKKQWVVKTDSDENSSDDEPLLKRKKLKLTIPLNVVNNKTQQNAGKRNSKKYSIENKSKGKSKQPGSRGRDVWSLMLLHLETMPYKECKSCLSKKKHRFLDSSFTTQGLFEDYRKYFLKETNSELGLGFTMYEKYFNKNCNYTILDADANGPNCPRCTIDSTKS